MLVWDLDLLYDNDRWLYWKLDNKALFIENNILKCWDADPVTRKRIKKIMVPFMLRGRLMEHAHHNLFQHHLSHIHEQRHHKLVQNFPFYPLACLFHE